VDADAMSENTSIEWCDSTFNPWTGCTKVSPGCDHCYAEGWAKRSGTVRWGPGAQRRRTTEANWRKPLQWERDAAAFQAAHGRRQRVFCASLADVFDKDAPDEWRSDLFRLIAETPGLDWLLLTKRIGNALRMLPPSWLGVYGYAGKGKRWPSNLRIGATFVNQEEVNRDMHKLLNLDVPNFCSIEPMLGPIRLDRIDRASTDGEWTYLDNALTGFQATKCGGYDGRRLEWVICGGESGPSARPMHPDWARSLRDQCASAGVPFFFKQWGEWITSEAEDQPVYRGEHRHLGGHVHAYRVGKKSAGRLLDGVEHNDFPEVK
jgi:protein gp37